MAKISPRSLIKESASILKEIMLLELASIGDAMISQVIGRARGLNPSEKLKAIQEISWPGEMEYRRKILAALAEIAAESINGARKEIPKAKAVKLVEKLESIELAANPNSIDGLPRALQDKLRKAADLLVGTQLDDLNKAVFFQYQESFDTTDSMELLEDDLNGAAMEYIEGSAITAGSMRVAAKMVNDARNAFFFEPEVLEEVDAFEFVNGDPVTDVCNDLNGTVFSKDDPNFFRYTPPLHWNCKSYIVPVLKGKLGNKEITALKPSTKKIEETIQFHECAHIH